MSDDVNIEKVVQAYHAIKAKRASLKREDESLEEDQTRLRAFLLDHLNKQGATSIKTEVGTVYRRKSTKASAADWNAVWNFAKEHDAMDIFQKRLTIGFVTDYMEANDGTPPPGVSVHHEFEIGVRKS